MNEYILRADVREKIPTKQLRAKRASGQLPAVLYGHGVKKNQTLWLNQVAFEKLYRQAGGSTIVKLEGAGAQALNIIVHDIEVNPLTHRVTHVDLLQVRMDEELTTHVPLEFVGESRAVKEQGGTLIRQAEEVEISCLPKDLPQHIEINLSTLATFDDRISVADIEVPAGVKILADPETVLAFVEEPRTQEEMDALDEAIDADVSQVEGLADKTDEKGGEEDGKKEAAAASEGEKSEG